MNTVGRTRGIFEGEFLVCSLCASDYSEPRTLPCLHSFCGQCLIKHISKHTGNERISGKRGFSCPECKDFVGVGGKELNATTILKGFPVNSFLTDLVDIKLLKNNKRRCDPCARNGSRSDGVAWCKNCKDVMCEDCVKLHKAMKVSLKHVVVTVHEIESEEGLLQKSEERCPSHPEKEIEFYCRDDDELCCPGCVAEEHRKCKKVEKIGDAAGRGRPGNNTETIRGALEKYQKHVGRLAQGRSVQLTRLKARKNALIQEFAQIRNDITQRLKTMEESLIKELQTKHLTETKSVQDDLQSCSNLMGAISNAADLMGVMEQHASPSRRLLETGRVRGQCVRYEDQIEKLSGKIVNTQYEFYIDESVRNLLKKTKRLGELKVLHTPTLEIQSPKVLTSKKKLDPNRNVTRSLPSASVELVLAIDVRSRDDIYECWLTGAVFFQDGRFLLVDRSNKSLKIFNDSNLLDEELGLKSKPWDVAKVTEDEVVVSLPEESRLQFVNVTDAPVMSRSILTEEPSYGIDVADDRIFTIAYNGDPPSLRILSLDGTELALIVEDDDGCLLFSKPLYVACNSSGSNIYVSDERYDATIVLEETSEHNFTCSKLQTGVVAGITRGDKDEMYICCNHANTVCVVSSKEDTIKTLIPRDEDLSYPKAIAKDDGRGRLLVTQGNSSVVKIYSLSSS